MLVSVPVGVVTTTGPAEWARLPLRRASSMAEVIPFPSLLRAGAVVTQADTQMPRRFASVNDKIRQMGLPRKIQISSMIRITTTINSSTKARLWLNWSTMKR